MKVYLTNREDRDEEFAFEIKKIVHLGGRINIVAIGYDKFGEQAQLRFYLNTTGNLQISEGIWSYPTPWKENSKFSDSDSDSGTDDRSSKIEGELEDFDGKTIIFCGTWKDADGLYDLEIDAQLTET
ncbi:hypothetical protein [Endozoicomonas sp. Mp262]|uniref:hypothetical protein n=1 Tax=Endozoicomonas sp. Mp262 TaxID=2919499 RepID=UPI0021DA5164